MRSGLLNEVACLVKTYKVTFRILHCLADGPVIGLPGVRVFGRTLETFDRFLLKIWYCSDISLLVIIVPKEDLRVAMYRRNSSTALRLGSVSLL